MKKLTLLLSLCMLPFFYGYSQALHLVEISFEEKSIFVEPGQSFTNFLVVKNMSQDSISVQDIFAKKKIPGLLLAPKGDFILASNEEKRIPFKFIATNEFMKMNTPAISFTVIYQKGFDKHEVEASFLITKFEEKNLAFKTSPLQYLDPQLPKTKVSFYVQNRSYEKRTIKVKFKVSPEGLTIEPKEINVTLEGQENQLVEFDVAVQRQRTFSPDFRVEVTAIDLGNFEDAGNTTINLVVLSSNRQMRPPLNTYSNQNSVEIMHNQTDKSFNYWQLKGNTDFNLKNNTTGRINTAIDYYANNEAYTIYDTWLELEHNNSLIRLGNIYGDDYDYSVSGRGAKAKWQINDKNALELLTVDNNYNLHSNYFAQEKNSMLIGTKYSFRTSKNQLGKAAYLYENNNRLRTETHLATIKTPFFLDSLHNFQTEVGFSSEKSIRTNANKLGSKLGVNYHVQGNKWEFNSINSMATSYYAGQNRGSKFFNQYVARQLKNNARVFLQFQHSDVQPHYINLNELKENAFDSIPDFFYQYREQIIQSGFQFRKNSWNVMLAPQVVQQKNLEQFKNNELFSYRFRSDFGTAFNKHALNLSLEYSRSKELTQEDWFNGFKTTLNYRIEGFNLNGTFQYNPHSVTDLYRPDALMKPFKNYNIHSSYNFNAFHTTLKGSVLIGINYSELYNNVNQNASINLDYKITPSWSATGYANYYNFESRGSANFSGSNSQVRLGIKKYFNAASNKGNHKVRMQLFHDKNNNGKLDYDDEVLTSEIIKLDKSVAITDKKGKVSFQNVPKGTYELKVNENEGLRLLMDPTIQVDGNKKINVALIRYNKITGTLVEIKQAYDDQETDVTGILVYAKDKNGNIKSTVVNQNNYFEFFLKDGDYEIFIENTTFQFIHPVRNVILAKDQVDDEVVFEYKKKNKEIKVKKF